MYYDQPDTIDIGNASPIVADGCDDAYSKLREFFGCLGQTQAAYHDSGCALVCAMRDPERSLIMTDLQRHEYERHLQIPNVVFRLRKHNGKETVEGLRLIDRLILGT